MTLEQELQSALIIRVRQRKELAELIGFETRNKFEILNSQNQPIGFAAEQNKGILGFLMRQFLGHWRPFEIHFFNADRSPVLVAKHPFRWWFQRLELYDKGNRFIGALQQRFSILHKRFDMEGPQRMVWMTVKSPIWRIWTFPFKGRNGQETAVIRKKWSGGLKEIFTDADNFEVEFKSTALQPDERLLLLASSVFIDLQFFERKARS